jgi:hypothetical protein
MESAPQPTRSFRSCLPGASLFPRLTFQRFAPFTSPSFNLPPENVQDLSFQPLAGSFTSPKKSSPLESSKSSLFFQNTRGGVSLKIPLLESTRSRLFFPDPFATWLPPGRRPSQFCLGAPVPRWQICGAERTLPPRHESDTAATEGSRGGRATLGEKCATGLSR